MYQPCVRRPPNVQPCFFFLFWKLSVLFKSIHFANISALYFIYFFILFFFFSFFFFCSNGFSVFKHQPESEHNRAVKTISDLQWLQHCLQSAIPAKGEKKKKKVPHNLFQQLLLVEATGSTNHCEVENDRDQNNVKLHRPFHTLSSGLCFLLVWHWVDSDRSQRITAQTQPLEQRAAYLQRFESILAGRRVETVEGVQGWFSLKWKNVKTHPHTHHKVIDRQWVGGPKCKIFMKTDDLFKTKTKMAWQGLERH